MPLYVSGSSAFRERVRGLLTHLDPGIHVAADGCVSWGDWDPTLASGPRMAPRRKSHELIRALIQSGYRIGIEETSSASECVPAHRSAGNTGSTIRWNPSQTLPHAPACPCILLGHELCHAHQLIRGAISGSEYYGGRRAQFRYEMLNITGQYGSESAGPAAITENDLRAEHIPVQQPRLTL